MRNVADTEGDKVEAQVRLGVTVNGFGVSDLATPCAHVSDMRSTTSSAAYGDAYDLAPELAARRRAARGAARGGPDRGRPPGFLGAGGFGAFTDTFEDLAGSAAARASPSSG